MIRFPALMTGLICSSLISLGVSSLAQEAEKATLAGGCFWCLEHTLDEVEGVIETTSGFVENGDKP